METRKARKAHICTLCHLEISAGTKYRYATITPWDHPDNETFGEFKAHWECEEEWQKIGCDQDWQFPQCNSDWMELITASIT